MLSQEIHQNLGRNYTVDPTPKPTLPKSELRNVVQLIAQAKGATPERDEVKAAVLDIAKRRSSAMMLTIDDQLAETHYKRECKKVIKDGNLYGTGILKGPLVERRVRVRYVFYEKSRRWTQKQEVYAVPFLAHTPIWNFYPDMSVTDIDDCWSVWERHMMTRPGLFELTKRKSFDGRAIRDYIQSNPRGMIQAQDIDTQLRLLGDRQNTRTVDNGLYEVLERWGWLTGEQLFGAGVEVPEGRRDENFFCNVWMLPNGKVIKLSIKPIQGMGYPYHLYYLERDETSIWGRPPALAASDLSSQRPGSIPGLRRTSSHQIRCLVGSPRRRVAGTDQGDGLGEESSNERDVDRSA